MARTRQLPLYAALAADLRRQIEGGVLHPGDRLPSIRAIQRARGVSAATAIEAYVRLERDGYVRARDRSGFYVAQPSVPAFPEPAAARAIGRPAPVGVGALVVEVLHELMDPRVMSLGSSAPAPELLPNARVNRLIRTAAARTPLHAATYGPPSGVLALRRQIARLALLAGISCSADEVIVTAGGIEALNLALKAVASPGDVVAIESPTYFGVLQTIESIGVHALERAITRHRVKAVVAMPTCHNPLGTVMPDAAKAELVALTGKHGVALIEDDVYGDLAFQPTRPRAAASFDRDGLVLWCGSFSKTIGPGLRVGWIVPRRFRARVELLKSVTSLSTAVLPQLAMADLLASGFYDRHVRRLRVRLADHLTRFSHAVGEEFPSGTKVTRPAGGSLLWVELPNVDGTRLYRRALEHGIAITPGEIFSTDAKYRTYIRLSYGAPWSASIERAIHQLARLAREIAG
jgi:DNA-binding transcriptional MocR family regulator